MNTSLDFSGFRVTSVVYADRLLARLDSKAAMGFYRASQRVGRTEVRFSYNIGEYSTDVGGFRAAQLLNLQEISSRA